MLRPNTKGFTWHTRGSLISALNAWTSTEGQAYADRLIQNAVAEKKHPNFPEDRLVYKRMCVKTLANLPENTVIAGEVVRVGAILSILLWSSGRQEISHIRWREYTRARTTVHIGTAPSRCRPNPQGIPASRAPALSMVVRPSLDRIKR